jgi:hypothetical protein
MSFKWLGDKYLQCPEHNQRRSQIGFVMRPIAMQHQMGDECSPEVTSSCSPVGAATALVGSGGASTGGSAAGGVISPAHSLGSSDIGEVDLEFWDLDLNAQNARSNLHVGARHVSGAGGPSSDTSGSISGRLIHRFYSEWSTSELEVNGLSVVGAVLLLYVTFQT